MERLLASRLAVLSIICSACLVGCNSDKALLDADPLTVARDGKFSTNQRVEAIGRAWNDAAAGRTNKPAVRSDLKDIAWSTDLPARVRIAALDAIFADDASTIEDSLNMTRLMIPREPAPQVTVRLCKEATERRWTDCTPALVRSLSRWREGTPDDQREEYAAIASLNPATMVESCVYDVFLHPPPANQLGFITPERVQADAWDLLRRLDKDGTIRASFVADLQRESGPDARVDGVALMRRAMRELRVVPLTGDEYLWLVSLGDAKDKSRSAWWSRTSSIVLNLDAARTGRLQMRHLEAIRWTSGAHADRLSMDRSALMSEARARLGTRHVHTRTVREREIHRAPPERLADWENKLSWGDLIAILAVDDAIHDRGVIASLFAQRDLDRQDEQAEYGGLLRCDGPDSAAPFSAVLYPPRQGERRGDKEFIASTDMMQQGDLALAHYHFHAQQFRNSDFAGPSYKDLGYASRFGRSCVVFTSMSRDSIDADYYQPDGIVIDLGDLFANR
jgi:hypothetical protein